MLAWFAKRRGRAETPKRAPGNGSRPADTAASEDTFRAGHEVLEIVGIGGQVPYAAFVDRIRRNAVEWFGPDPVGVVGGRGCRLATEWRLP